MQVLTAIQKVLGAVRMQQQREPSRASGGLQQPASLDFTSRTSCLQRVMEAERAETAAQQVVKALQKKEAVWEAELGAAQTSNAQLHKQVGRKLPLCQWWPIACRHICSHDCTHPHPC